MIVSPINFVYRDSLKFIYEMNTVHKTIKITAVAGAMGIYLKERAAKPILPENQPSKLRPAIKSTR
jgi:hypothetical protein